MFMESYRRLIKFADGVASLPEIDAGRIFLLGFSMGTIMSYALSLTYPEKFAGVVAQSGFVRDHPELEFKWNALSDCAFIITHGVNDPVIPISSRPGNKGDVLKIERGVSCTKEYPMGHEISGESLADVCGWLKKKLD